MGLFDYFKSNETQAIDISELYHFLGCFLISGTPERPQAPASGHYVWTDYLARFHPVGYPKTEGKIPLLSVAPDLFIYGGYG